MTDAGAGASTGTGQGTFSYTYSTNTATSLLDSNTWQTKTVETLQDGTTNTVYTNGFGQVMLSVYTDASSNKWITYNRYDAQGRLVFDLDGEEYEVGVGTAPVIAEGIQDSLADNIGKHVDFKRIDSDLTDVTGLGRFARAGFQLTHRDGQEGLLIRTDEKAYAPPTVNPLFIIDGSDYTDVRFSLGARVTFHDIGGFGSELRNDFIVGTSYGASSEYYHPLNWFSHFFVAPRGFATVQPFDIYMDDTRIATYRELSAGEGSTSELPLIDSQNSDSAIKPTTFPSTAA